MDLRSYKRRDIVDFSPRAQSAGANIYSELGLYQTVNLQSFQGGFGFPWHTATKTNVYLRTDGSLDTRHANAVMLMTKPTVSDSDIKADGFIEYGGDIYAWSTDGVSVFTSSDAVWTSDVSTDSVRDMWHNGWKIFVARETDTLMYGGTDARATTDWTECGATTDQIGALWIQHHDGFVYVGKESVGGSDGHRAFYDDSIIMSDMYLVASDDPQAIPIGLNGRQVKKPISYRGDLLFPRADGVYRMDKDKKGARVILDYKDKASSENFRSWAIHNGQLIFPVRDALYQWNGVRTVPTNPQDLTDKYPFLSYGQFDNFVTSGRFLYMTARTNADVYTTDNWEEHIVCFDGVSWHKLLEASTDGVSTINAMYYDVINDYLWFDKASEVSYIPFNVVGDLPYEDFYATSDLITHSLVTPKIDAGYRRVTKSTPSLLMEGHNLSTNQYLEMFYALDGDVDWLPWGGDSGLSNVMTSDGVHEFINPQGEDKSTLEYKNISFKIDFVSNASTATPVLEGIYPRLIMRPDTLYGWNMNIKASPRLQYGTALSHKTPKEIVDELQKHRDSKAPLDFEDIYGDKFKVYVSSINEAAIEEHVDRPGPAPEIEQMVTINLVQVG